MAEPIQVNYAGNKALTVAYSHLSGQRALSGGVLILSFAVKTPAHAPGSEVTLYNFDGMLTLDDMYVGSCYRFGNSHFVGDGQEHDWGHLAAAFALGPDVLRALGRARKHGLDYELTLSVRLNLHLKGPSGPRIEQVTTKVELTQSDWTRTLKQMQYESYVTFEAPIEGAVVPDVLKDAVAHFRKATELLQQGNWKNSLSECRDALDSLQSIPLPAAPPRADWANKAAREAWDLATRFAFVRESIRHIMNVAHHKGSASQEEARSGVFLTAGIIAHYADSMRK